MPPDMLKTLPGYDPDVQKNRAQARQIMEKLGYGPDNRLQIKVTTRDLPYFRDPAVILIDQLKEVYIDGELETIDTTNWLPKVMRKDYTVGLNLAGSGPDPDQNLYLLYGCGGDLNYNGYCSAGGGQADRAAIDRGRRGTAQAAGVGRSNASWPRTAPGRSSFIRRGGTCWQPHVKGLTIMVNSIFSGNRRGRHLARQIDAAGERAK